MRYFVVSGTDPSIVHIIAEIVRELESADRRDSLAGQLAGPRVRVLTEEEILSIPGGWEILDRWRKGDDGRFHLESLRLVRETERKEHKPTLRLVADVGSADGSKLQEGRLTSLLERAVDLQAQAMEIIKRMEARPARRGARRPASPDEERDGIKEESTRDGR